MRGPARGLALRAERIHRRVRTCRRSAWGGVIWLLAVTSAMTLAVLTPQLVPLPVPLLVFGLTVVLMYFLLSWLAAQEAR